MPQVSRRVLDEKIKQRILDCFLLTLVDLKDLSDARAFFDAVLTQTEQMMLAKRLAIALLLEKGYDYRTIERVLKVSTATTAAVNNKRGILNQAFNRTVSKFLSRENKEQFWDEIEAVLGEVGSIVAGPYHKKTVSTLVNYHLRQKQKNRPF